MAVIALGSVAMLNFEKIDQVDLNPAVISVTGEGEVLAVPDIGQFSFSVNAEGETASQAQEESGTKINDILAYLKEQGIEDKDIKTQGYNLYPRYRWEEQICPVGTICRGGEQVQDGFEVSQTVSVKVRDTERAGELITGVGERGATNISRLNFTIDDVDALQAEARAKAIADAQEKAAILTEQLGVRIIGIQYFNENSGNYSRMYESRAMSMDMASEEAGFGGAEMPVGEESTNVTVTIGYEVR